MKPGNGEGCWGRPPPLGIPTGLPAGETPGEDCIETDEGDVAP